MYLRLFFRGNIFKYFLFNIVEIQLYIFSKGIIFKVKFQIKFAVDHFKYIFLLLFISEVMSMYFRILKNCDKIGRKFTTDIQCYISLKQANYILMNIKIYIGILFIDTHLHIFD